MKKTKQLIKELKEKIERKERYLLSLPKKESFKSAYFDTLQDIKVIKAQLQFAEKLIKAIKEDVNGLLNYFDELRGGMLNRVNVLDFYDELNKILDEALK